MVQIMDKYDEILRIVIVVLTFQVNSIQVVFTVNQP